jgi:hypothetical protein
MRISNRGYMMGTPPANGASGAIAAAVNQTGGNWAQGGGFGPGFPSFQQAANAYAVTTGGWEAIRQSLYDSQQYVAAGSTNLSFFNIPLGQGTSWTGTGAKNLEDTNMQLAGQLPQNNAMLVQSIEVEFWPVTPTVAADMPSINVTPSVVYPTINDVYIFRRAGSLIFNVGNKQYLQEAPLAKFPGKTSFHLDAAVADADAAAVKQTVIAFADVIGRPYGVQGLFLQPTQAFNIQLAWGTAQAIVNPARVFVRLDGIFYRQSQ